MQLRIFVLVCAALVCVAESRLFNFRRNYRRQAYFPGPTEPVPTAESESSEETDSSTDSRPGFFENMLPGGGMHRPKMTFPGKAGSRFNMTFPGKLGSRFNMTSFPGKAGSRFNMTSFPGKLGSRFNMTSFPGKVGSRFNMTSFPGKVGSRFNMTSFPGKAGSRFNMTSPYGKPGSNMHPISNMTPLRTVHAENVWPYAMMEFSILVGKCVAAKFGKMHGRASEGILFDSCPRVFAIAKLYAEADDTTREKAEEFAEDIFHLLQCVNLQAVKETFKTFKNFNNFRPTAPPTRGYQPTMKLFFTEAEELFKTCEQVFADTEINLADWENKFAEEAGSGEEAESGEEAVETLRQALSQAYARGHHRGRRSN